MIRSRQSRPARFSRGEATFIYLVSPDVETASNDREILVLDEAIQAQLIEKGEPSRRANEARPHDPAPRVATRTVRLSTVRTAIKRKQSNTMRE
jgi:hypothetical protein